MQTLPFDLLFCCVEMPRSAFVLLTIMHCIVICVYIYLSRKPHRGCLVISVLLLQDGAVFYHWRKVADEGKDYPFARFNKVRLCFCPLH